MSDFGEADVTYRRIVRLATPLILSMSGYMLMLVVDALFLSWYAATAIAAVVPASMATYVIFSLLQGVAGYTSVLVSQYTGAGQRERVASAVWQGTYFAVGSGLAVALLGFAGRPFFAWVGHAPEVQVMEVSYFRILCFGGPIAMAASALSGFFAGRGATGTLFLIQGTGMLVNAVLDYLLIFGRLGLPSLGVAGAALATVLAQGVVAAISLGLFLTPRCRREFGTWSGRAFDVPMLARLMRFGFPNGIRYAIESLAWSAFIFFVGRVGTLELASTNIAWRINGLAFFPIIGLSQAVAILVGKAQGSGRSDLSVRATWRGLIAGEVWMVTAAALFVLFPEPLYRIFYDPATTPAAAFAVISKTGVVLLRYVALYCLLDGLNIVIVGSLQAAGDTRWTLLTSCWLHALFLAGLFAADAQRLGLDVEWIIATVFVMVQALVWLARFRQGRWRQIRVIEAQGTATR